jgi:large subunit ribosomal protein L19
MSICFTPAEESCCPQDVAEINNRAIFFGERKEVMNVLDKIEAEQLKKDVTEFAVGDSVKVHTRVIEGDKERIQIYAGIVIGRKGTGVNENFTVRRVSYGEGVERVFPLHSPRIAKIEVEKRGAVRRAKLNYLRTRKGKSATTVKERARATAAAA